MDTEIILASSSPRRAELIRYLGIAFDTDVSDAEEITEGAPDILTAENAKLKAQAVSRRHPGRWVLGADTLVFACGQPLGKPRDREDALRMLRMLSGKWHEVYTGICLTNGTVTDTRVSVSRVHFTDMTESDMLSYIATGEPFDKAGAYALQGAAGAFIDRAEGSFSGVIGLDICLTHQLLRSHGLI